MLRGPQGDPVPDTALPQEQRREEFVTSKRQITVLMEELEHTPDTSFERDVVCEDEEAFCLSKDNIMALQNLLQQVCGALRQCWGLLCALAAAATVMEEHPLGFGRSAVC